MSLSEKNQALAVVIEKLTEIVDNINQRSRSGDTSPNTDGQSPDDERSQHVLMEISPEEALGAVDDDAEQDVNGNSSPTELQEVEITTAAIEEIVSSNICDTDSDDIVHIVNIEPVTKTSELPPGQADPDVQDGGKRLSVPEGGHRELYKCIKCDYVSHNKHYLKQHVVLVHTADRPFKCPLCDYSGKRSHSLKEHLVVHSPYRPFTCPFCRASFRKKGHLTNHIKIHASDQGLPCSICKQVLPSRAELSEHMRQEHTGEIHFCEVCSYATANEAEIIMHKHNHGYPTVYSCSTCKYITIQESLIRKHITASHNGQGAFKVNTSPVQSRPVVLLKCSDCGFVTNDKVKLRHHMIENHIGSSSGPTSGNTTGQKEERSSQSSPKPQSLDSCVAGHSKDVKMTPPGSPSDSEDISADGQQQGYTQHKVSGVCWHYCCMICGYTCDQQRSIKAHIWKHSGRKDINYPIFQSRQGEPRDAASEDSNKQLLTTNTVQDCVESNFGAEIKTAGKKYIKHHENEAGRISQHTKNTINSVQDSQKIAIKTENIHSPVQDKLAEESISAISRSVQRVQKLSESACNCRDPRSERLHGVKRKAAAHSSELDVSMPKLRIVNSSSSYSLPEVQDQGSPESNSTENGTPTSGSSKEESQTITPVQQSGKCGALSFKEEKEFKQHEISDVVGSDEQVMLMKDDPGDEYMLEVEVETTEDAKSTTDIASDIPNELEHADENMPADSQQPISLRALLQRQRSSNDLPGLRKAPVARNRSGSLELDASEDNKELGISSSLLAVIEQFRQDASSGSQSMTVDSDVIPGRYVEKCKDEYRCRICPFSSVNVTSIKIHLRSHSKPKKLCSLCSFVAESNEQLHDHMTKFHPKTAHTAPRVGPQSSDVVVETKRAKQYICENCDCSFNTIEALLKHKMKKLCWNKHNTSGGSDNGSSEEKDCFKCNFCDYVGMSVRSLKSHMKRHWNDLKANQLHEDVQLPAAHDPTQVEKYYVCVRCTSVFSGIMELLAHKQSACVGVVPKCMHCSFSSSDAELFKKHMSHHVGKLYKCEQCEFVSKSYSKMDTHLKQHIEPSDLHCTLCDFMATSVRSLKSHMKRHDNDQRFVRQPLEQYKCKMCGYICHHLPALKSHMWRHASDSSYSYEKTNAVINAALEMGFEHESPGTTTKDASQEDVVVPSSADYSRKVVDGLVAFRCCHCFYETCAKNELNEHMKKHIDIIRKTMEVNNDLFVTRDKVDDT